MTILPIGQYMALKEPGAHPDFEAQIPELIAAGEITPAGAQALAAHKESRYDAALRRNVLHLIRADAMIVLGKLIRGEPLTAEDRNVVNHRSLLACVDWTKDRGWYATAFGRKLYSLSAGRTY